MVIIACVDDGMGMMFNKRRQSADSVLIKKVCDMTQGSVLWIKQYSKKLFEGWDNIRVDDDCLKKAQTGEFCFIEDDSCAEFENDIEKIILFRWNRRYPADLYFGADITKNSWKIKESFEFAGSSHEKITAQILVKE